MILHIIFILFTFAATSAGSSYEKTFRGSFGTINDIWRWLEFIGQTFIVTLGWIFVLGSFFSVLHFPCCPSIFVILIAVFCINPFNAGASEVERRLHQKLFQNYNLKVRPALYWEEKVMVRVGMTLSQLVSLVNTSSCTKK